MKIIIKYSEKFQKLLSNNKFEGIGLILVLFSFFIQIAEEEFTNQKQESEYYNIHKKLDAIWHVYSKDFSTRKPGVWCIICN